jgi:hypothetical protein
MMTEINEDAPYINILFPSPTDGKSMSFLKEKLRQKCRDSAHQVYNIIRQFLFDIRKKSDEYKNEVKVIPRDGSECTNLDLKDKSNDEIIKTLKVPISIMRFLGDKYSGDVEDFYEDLAKILLFHQPFLGVENSDDKFLWQCEILGIVTKMLQNPINTYQEFHSFFPEIDGKFGGLNIFNKNDMILSAVIDQENARFFSEFFLNIDSVLQLKGGLDSERKMAAGVFFIKDLEKDNRIENACSRYRYSSKKIDNGEIVIIASEKFIEKNRLMVDLFLQKFPTKWSDSTQSLGSDSNI